MEDAEQALTYFSVMNDALCDHRRYLEFSFGKHVELVCEILLLRFVAILR